MPCYDHEYSYDGTGNITNIRRDEQDSLYEYETWHGNCDEPGQPMPHAVKQIGDDYYCYDGNGNMVERHDQSGSYEQEFDVENRLVAVTETVSSAVTLFFYDASGQRLLTIEPDGTEIYYPFVGMRKKLLIRLRFSAVPTSWQEWPLLPVLAATRTRIKTAYSSSTATIWAATAS